MTWVCVDSFVPAHLGVQFLGQQMYPGWCRGVHWPAMVHQCSWGAGQGNSHPGSAECAPPLGQPPSPGAVAALTLHAGGPTQAPQDHGSCQCSRYLAHVMVQIIQEVLQSAVCALHPTQSYTLCAKATAVGRCRMLHTGPLLVLTARSS